MSSGVPPPDWAALYTKHKDKMWRVAAGILRESGRQSDAQDVVHEALRSLMTSPPAAVDNWEALLIATVRRRALDVLNAARIRHDGGELPDDTARELASNQYLADDVAAAVDHERAGGVVWDALGALDPRDRQIVWSRIVHERSLRDLAHEFDLSEGRISQITKKSLAVLRDELRRQGIDGW